MSTLERSLHRIVTRCEYLDVDDPTVDCQVFGLSRTVYWHGIRDGQPWRLCGQHVDRLLLDYAEEIRRIK